MIYCLTLNSYNSSTGMISAFTQQIVPIPPDTAPPQMEEKADYAIAPFYCNGGCGGNNTDEFDVTKYEFGKCVSMDKCEYVAVVSKFRLLASCRNVKKKNCIPIVIDL